MTAMTREIRTAVEQAHREFVSKSDAGYAAKPYTVALLQVPYGETRYGEDDVTELIIRLLNNLKGWRGETARSAKSVLRKA